MQRYKVFPYEYDADDDGDFILYADYEKEYQALWRECEELAKQNKRLREGLERIVRDKEPCYCFETGECVQVGIAKEALEG